MIELNDLAFQNADILITLDDAPDGQLTKAGLADKVGRDVSNLRKTLRVLAGAGLLDKRDPMAGLTDEGRVQLAAIQRARHGGEKRRPRGRCPANVIVRNPANRIPKAIDVAALADVIESSRDVLQPILLTPPDANGVRMILAGEHRWLAVQLLAQENRLPTALAEGLPFQEREATDAEQILIRIAENTHAEVSPLDDARQLLALHLATGWSGREIATRLGRRKEGTETGVRDVQKKIQIARDATAEAVAEYERTGSWDVLVASVTQRQEIVTTKPQRLALAELWHKAGREQTAVAVLPAVHSAEGARLAGYGLAILTRNEHGDTAQVTAAGVAYLEAEGLTGSIETVRERLGFPTGYGVSTYRTEWLNTSPAGAPGVEPTPDQDAVDAAGIDPVTRTSVLDAPWREVETPQWKDGLEHCTLKIYRADGGSWAASASGRVGALSWSEGYNLDQLGGAAIDRLSALKSARIRVMDKVGLVAAPIPMRLWLDSLLGPHYVAGIDRLNATMAGETRRALGWERRPSNSGGGKSATKDQPAPPAPPPPPPAPELTEASKERLHQIADWIDDNPSGNGAGFETMALGRDLSDDERLLCDAGHLTSLAEGDATFVVLTQRGRGWVRMNPSADDRAVSARCQAAFDAAKADPAAAEAEDTAAIESLAGLMRARAARHRARGGGRWSAISERELARQLLAAVGNGELDRAATLIAYMAAQQEGGVESQALRDAGGSWLLSTQVIAAFNKMAAALRTAADPDHPAHLVQMEARDALEVAAPHLRPTAPQAEAVTS